jgi:uncharacterized protein (TIGR03437 family)
MRLQTTALALLLSVSLMGQSGPPSGYNVVVPAPTSVGGPSSFGDYVDLALDANGDPGLTYIVIDPSGSGDLTQNALYFVRWDRSANRWTSPVQVAVVGNTTANGLTNVSSLAYDASNNTWGVVYNVGDSQARIDYARSADGGATWTTTNAAPGEQGSLAGPALAMAGGKLYFAYVENGASIHFLTGTPASAPSAWTETTVGSLGGGIYTPLSVKIDSAGNPGLAFWSWPSGGYNSILGFWRPGYQIAIQVGDSNGEQNDDAAVSLSFAGTNPRVAVHIYRDPNGADNPLYSSKSDDGGQTWGAFVPVPPDTGQYEGGRLSLAIDSKGNGAVGVEQLGGNDQGQCTPPLAARTADFITWTGVCNVTGNNAPTVSEAYPRLAFDKSDRLYYAFQNTDSTDLPAGVVLWYQPGAQANGPHINDGGIKNGASFLDPIAPGSIASIFGTNFMTGAAVGAVSTPLPTRLDAASGPVSVTVNGIAAPLFYAGPGQINFQVPNEVPPGQATVVVTSNSVNSNAAVITVLQNGPGIFVYGNNLAVVQNPDYSVNSPGNPAKPGDYLVVYATGGGAVDHPVPSGSPTPPAPPLSNLLQPATATIGSENAAVSFAGLAPGFVGLTQINVQVPEDLADGNYPLQVTINGVTSNAPNIAVAK